MTANLIQPFTTQASLIKGAGCMILSKNTGTFLFGQRSMPDRFAGQWCTFGGTTEPNEDALTTAVREIGEEAGIDLGNYITDPNPLYIDKTPKVIFTTFLTIVDSEINVTLNNEHSDYGWFDIKSFPTPMHPGINRMLSDPNTLRRLLSALSNR